MGFSLLTLLGACAWLGKDLYDYFQQGGTFKLVFNRLLYTILSATNFPVLQLLVGGLMSTTYSWSVRRSGDKQLGKPESRVKTSVQSSVVMQNDSSDQ